jgi:primary-amine oxidase
MKTITKFIHFGLPMLALACGSIASAQIPLEPLIPPDSAAKAPTEPLPRGDSVTDTVKFDSKSQWHLTLHTVDKSFPGLIITGASFQRSPMSPFIYVLHDGRLAEIFVPYHNDSHRYKDISGFTTFKMLKLDPADFPKLNDANGKPTREILPGGKICKQVRDYLAWMNPLGRNPPLVRYGQEVVYFSVLGAGNYAYIMEWTFRDDGTILVRAGSTGPKAPDVPLEGHMHNFTWRLDIDLNGASANTAFWKSHSEDLTATCLSDPKGGECATDKREEIKTEGSEVWDPKQFNTLEIQNASLRTDPQAPLTSYELVPMRTGTARHLEPFTQADFWVTLFDRKEIVAEELPNYVRAGRSAINKDLVIWYTGSEHHENGIRAEDKFTVPVLWTGFELVPQNLWEYTPFYPCTEAGCG